MLIVQTDGAFDQKTNTSAISYIIKDFSSKKVLTSYSGLTNAADNHQAEFLALTKALEYLVNQEMSDNTISIQSDSKGLLDAVNKDYSKHYPTNIAEITRLLSQFSLYYTKLLKDKDNKAAHQLATTALFQ